MLGFLSFIFLCQGKIFFSRKILLHFTVKTDFYYMNKQSDKSQKILFISQILLPYIHPFSVTLLDRGTWSLSLWDLGHNAGDTVTFTYYRHVLFELGNKLRIPEGNT